VSSRRTFSAAEAGSSRRTTAGEPAGGHEPTLQGSAVVQQPRKPLLPQTYQLAGGQVELSRGLVGAPTWGGGVVDLVFSTGGDGGVQVLSGQ